MSELCLTGLGHVRCDPDVEDKIGASSYLISEREREGGKEGARDGEFSISIRAREKLPR